MYNEAQKRAFIAAKNYKTHTIKSTVSVFGITERFEDELGKDICQMDEEEIKYVGANAFNGRYNTNSTYICRLREYGRWCVDSGVEGAQKFLSNISADSFDAMQHMMIKNPDELATTINKIFEPPVRLYYIEGKTSIKVYSAQVLYRVYVWLAYYGFTQEEIVNVKTGDLSFPKNGTVRVARKGDKAVTIPKDAQQDFRICADAPTFYYDHHTSYVSLKRARVDNDYLLRGFKTHPTAQTIARNASRYMSDAYKVGRAEKNLTYSRIKQSGVYYRIFSKLDKNTAALDQVWETVVEEYMRGNTYSIEGQERARIKARLKKDYGRWMEVFDLKYKEKKPPRKQLK